MQKRTKQPRIVYTKHMRKRAKRNPITIILPIVSLAALLWLAWCSQQEHEYSKQERQQMDKLVESLSGEASPKKLTRLERRAAIMDLWNISEADLSKPVVLWKD